MKYHIKALGLAKTQGFRQGLYGYDLVLYLQRLCEHLTVSRRA